MINELPKEHRFKKKFIIPAYIYCDKHDLNMITFLNPLIEYGALLGSKLNVQIFFISSFETRLFVKNYFLINNNNNEKIFI